MPREPLQARLRITNQFRRGDAMIYDLLCEDVRRTLEVAQRPNEGGCGQWPPPCAPEQSR